MKKLLVFGLIAAFFLPLNIVQRGAVGKEAIKVAYGWSTNDDLVSAVREGVTSLKKGLEGKTPQWVLLFSTVGYHPEEVLGQLNQLLPPGVQIQGETSCSGVMTRDGYHQGRIGSLALLGIWCPRMSFGVGACSLKEVKTPREVGREAVLRAIEKVQRGKGELPKLVFISPSSVGNEEDILAGIEDVWGRGKVPIFGGAAGDDKIEGKWRVFANDKVYSDGVVLTLIYTDMGVGYTDMKLGYAFLSGFEPTDRKAAITKAKGRVIYEFDHQPAGEVYNRWIGGRLSDKLNQGGNILLDTNLDPLGEKIGRFSYLLIHPKEFHPQDRSLEVFARVKEGSELFLMRGDRKMLVTRAGLAARLARSRGRIPKEDVAGGILIYCAGTMLAIPENERGKMASEVNDALGNTPFIGAFTFGEQGFFSGGINRHGNLMVSMIVFSKK